MTLNSRNLWWIDLSELEPLSLSVFNVRFNTHLCQIKLIINSPTKSVS